MAPSKTVRTAKPPLFRIKDDSPGLAMMVSRPAQGLAVARDGSRYTNMYETTIPARTLLLATLVAFVGSAAAASSLGGVRLLPAD
jgi:hypothetical protein